MPIVEADLAIRISGGPSNTDPNLSLGGAMSTDANGEIVSGQPNNDMDAITGDESSAGITIYHAYYYQNNHASLTWINPVIWIESQTSSSDTSVDIAISDEAKNVALETVPNEETAPVGPVFSTPANKAAGLAIESLDAGDNQGFWVKYTVNTSSPAATDSYTISAEGDSNQ
mgnify:CR=1 FL=1